MFPTDPTAINAKNSPRTWDFFHSSVNHIRHNSTATIFELFRKNSSYVSGVSVCIFVALYLCNFVTLYLCIFVSLYLCIFVTLYVRMFVARANKVEGTMS